MREVLGIKPIKHVLDNKVSKKMKTHIKDTCLNRLNVIKLLCHKNWKLKSETLVNIYKLLISSIIEYSMFLFNILSKTHKLNLQRIQNKALRAIFYNQRHLKTKELHELAKIDTVEERMEKLKDKYLKKNLTNENPLITQMIEEYEIFNQITKWRKHKTVLDDWSFINDIHNDSDEDNNENEEIETSFDLSFIT